MDENPSMRAKPKGTKYRNLNCHGGVIYYDRTVKGRRICFSTRTSDWVEAAAFAWLAKRCLAKEPGNLPGVTGASRAAVLGGIFPA